MTTFRLTKRIGLALTGNVRVFGDISDVVPASQWVVNGGSLSFIVGNQTPFNVAATGPASYTAGGVYGTDPAGTPLPAGMGFTEGGSLTVGAATVANVSGIRFAYYEPGALPVLTLYNNSITGTLPYMATWFPHEGVVPAGYNAVSPEDPTLRGAVITTWPDGSARVIVLAGSTDFASANISKTITLRVGQPTGNNLTTTDIVASVQSITVNFGTPITLNLTTANHDRIWWQSPQVICARYRIPITNKGDMEAVIDIHTFAGGRSFVEFVIENCKVNSTLSSVSIPAVQSYTGATLAINGGAAVATLGMPTHHTWGGNDVYLTEVHRGLRAVYVGAWVLGGVATPIRGASDPFVEVVHDAASVQALHVFPGKAPRARTYNAQTGTSVAEYQYGKATGPVTQAYQLDLYAPWDYGRNKGSYMGAPGGIRQIPIGDWQYVQLPDRWTRRAVIASTLGLLSFPINYRDSTTHDVPTWAQIGSKQRSSLKTWPEDEVTNSITGPYPDYEGAHQPGYGLLAFMCQPSPVFIELMQKICCWNGSWSAPVSAPNYAQTRQRAWLLRNAIHTLYITPDGHPYKSSAEQSLAGYISYLDQFRTSGRFELGVFMGVTITSQEDARYSPTTGVEGFQAGPWQQSWVMLECVRAHRTKIHSNATTRALIKTVADWQTSWVINWVNDRVAAGTDSWKFFCQYPTVGRYSSTTQFFTADPDCFTNWDEADQWSFTDYPPPAVTTWWCSDAAGANFPEQPLNGTKPKYSNYVPFGGSPFYDYAAYTWPAFCAAAESGLPGADEMWATIKAGITNLGAYLNSTATDPNHKCAWPRNKPVDV